MALMKSPGCRGLQLGLMIADSMRRLSIAVLCFGLLTAPAVLRPQPSEAPKVYTSTHLAVGDASQDLVINGGHWDQRQLTPAWARGKKSARHNQIRATRTPARRVPTGQESSPYQTH